MEQLKGLSKLTFRPKLSDIEAMIERLNRNMQSSGCKTRFMKKEYNGYIHLHNIEGNEGFSFGNSKNELYWQLALANKVLEETKRTNKN